MRQAEANSIGAPLVPKVKPSEVVRAAYDMFADEGIYLSLNKIHKMLRKMWAEESKRERSEDRLVDYQGSLSHGQDRLYRDDPVGEVASELVDYIRGWKPCH